MNKETNVHILMRQLHNYTGYFLTGLILMYSLSGIVMIYRDADVFKTPVKYEKEFAKQLNEAELGKELKIRDFKVEKQETNLLIFKEGNYNVETGVANYTMMEQYKWLDKFTELHKSRSGLITHYFTLILGIGLLFLCISAFWMSKPNTKAFKRGILITLGGMIFVVIMLFL